MSIANVLFLEVCLGQVVISLKSKRIQNSVKHLRWNVLRQSLTAFSR